MQPLVDRITNEQLGWWKPIESLEKPSNIPDGYVVNHIPITMEGDEFKLFKNGYDRLQLWLPSPSSRTVYFSRQMFMDRLRCSSEQTFKNER